MGDVIAALAKFPYFGPWEEAVVKECCELAKVKAVPPDTILIGEGCESESGVEEMAYFILEGSCKVILCSGKLLTHKNRSAKFSFSNIKDLPSTENLILRIPHTTSNKDTLMLKQENEKLRFLECAKMCKGGCFGLGENLKDRYIISSTAMVCLLIPRSFLLQHNPYNIWNRIKQFLTLYLPSDKRALQELAINRKWLDYRKNEVQWIIRNRNIDTKVTNIDSPYSLRIMELELGTK